MEPTRAHIALGSWRQEKMGVFPWFCAVMDSGNSARCIMGACCSYPVWVALSKKGQAM